MKRKNPARGMINRVLKGEDANKIWNAVLEEEGTISVQNPGPVGSENVPGEAVEDPQEEPTGHLDDSNQHPRTQDEDIEDPDDTAEEDNFNKMTEGDTENEVLEGDIVNHPAMGRCEVLATSGDAVIIRSESGHTANVPMSTLKIEEEGPVGDADVPGEDPEAIDPQDDPDLPVTDPENAEAEDEVVDQGDTSVERRRGSRNFRREDLSESDYESLRDQVASLLTAGQSGDDMARAMQRKCLRSRSWCHTVSLRMRTFSTRAC